LISNFSVNAPANAFVWSNVISVASRVRCVKFVKYLIFSINLFKSKPLKLLKIISVVSKVITVPFIFISLKPPICFSKFKYLFLYFKYFL
jgi:hypothetical protein